MQTNIFRFLVGKLDRLIQNVHVAVVFPDQKHIPPTSPPESPQGPGVRHLIIHHGLEVSCNGHISNISSIYLKL